MAARRVKRSNQSVEIRTLIAPASFYGRAFAAIGILTAFIGAVNFVELG